MNDDEYVAKINKMVEKIGFPKKYRNLGAARIMESLDKRRDKLHI